MLKTGTKAPGFKLDASPDGQISLEGLKGKKVILAFYPADWSPVCSDQMSLYNVSQKLFDKSNAVVIGISVDGKWSHKAFAEARNFKFPLLADFEPKGAVSKAYEAYDEINGRSKRALYVIDEDGIIRWSYLSPDGVNPGVDGILEALDKLTKNQKKP